MNAPHAPPSPAVDAQSDHIRAALRLWVILNRAMAAIASHATEDIRRHGLSVGEFSVLELLYHKGPTLLGEIQRGVLVSSGGITFLVDKLEEKGLVERLDCPEDRRARFAALTPAGRALIAGAFPVHAERLALVMSGLDEQEQTVAADLLKRLGLHAASV